MGINRVANEDASYDLQHSRVRRAMGKASDYTCVDCKDVAAEWSWAHGSDRNSAESYSPRCIPCHRKYDEWDASRFGSVSKNVGEDHPAAVITESDVLEMRRLRQSGWSNKDLAYVYGISASHVCNIISGRKWAHV